MHIERIARSLVEQRKIPLMILHRKGSIRIVGKRHSVHVLGFVFNNMFFELQCISMFPFISMFI